MNRNQIQNMTVKTRTGYATTGAGLLIPFSDRLSPSQRWRVVGCRFFLTPFAATDDGDFHSIFMTLEDSDGFVFQSDFTDVPGSGALAAGGGYSSPWFTFDEGLIGGQKRADLRFRPVIGGASGYNLSLGWVGVQVAARVEDE